MENLAQTWPINHLTPDMDHIFPIYQVDAFANEPFKGNPAAVCYMMAPKPDDWMQNVAAEMNLAETAFFVPKKDGTFSLRWFTPTAEVDLCGHATLATAHILWAIQLARPDETIRFETRSGILTARQLGEMIELDFTNESAAATQIPAGLQPLFDQQPVWFGQNRMDWIAELASEQAVLDFEPDLRLLKTLPSRGLIITAPADRYPADFVSRFFAPAVGVDEDPVTGSAHCCLGPYWANKLNKPVVTGYQASRRGGYVVVEPKGERVLLRGKAVTVMQGVVTV